MTKRPDLPSIATGEMLLSLQGFAFASRMIALADQFRHFLRIPASVAAVIFAIRCHAVTAGMFALLWLIHIVSSCANRSITNAPSARG